MQKLFDRFDKVYCINLPHRTDRRENFLSEVTKYDLGDFEFFNAYYGQKLPNLHNLPSGCVGLIQTNIDIIKKSIDNNYETIAILEDDCTFTDEVSRIDTYFNHLPNDWDMLYLGGNHNLHWSVAAKPIVINDKVIKLQHTFTTHFVGIKRNMFEIILSNIERFSEPIDVVYAELQKKYNIYSFYPSIAKQLAGYSDIEKKQINYDFLIK